MEYAGMAQSASINHSLGGLAQQAKMERPRIFQELMKEVQIAIEATQPARANLTELMTRLGVQKDYGGDKLCAEVQPSPSGEADQLRALISDMQDAARDLRGMAETLAARL